MLALARLGQGAAASAFSPASSAAVARLAGKERLGRYFGRYGAWKSLGYVLGPLIGVVLVRWAGLEALYIAVGALGAAAAVWVLYATVRRPVCESLMAKSALIWGRSPTVTRPVVTVMNPTEASTSRRR